MSIARPECPSLRSRLRRMVVAMTQPDRLSREASWP